MQYAEDESTNEGGDGGTIYKTVKGITVNPISTEKVYFTVTLDPIVYVPEDYKAGDSFGSFITLYEQDVDKTPFYNPKVV